MGYWSIIVPEDGKNYCKHPKFSKGTITPGWGSFSDGTAVGTRTVVSDWQKFDVYSWKIEKTGGSGNFGGFFNLTTDLSDWQVGDRIVSSCYFYNPQLLSNLRIQINYTDNGVPMAKVTSIPNGTLETRLTVISDPIVSPLTAQITTYLMWITGGTPNGYFYIDGMTLERRTAAEDSYATTFFDGDSEGCYWLATPNASKSIRVAEKSNGGREYNLDSLGYYVVNHSGSGMAPIELFTQIQAALPGELLKGYRVGARDMQIQLIPQPTSQPDLHSKRKALIDILRPDRFENIKPVILKYTGANSSKSIQIPVVYDTGMEYNQPQSGFSEDTVIRLRSLYPYWEEEGNRAYSLSHRKTLAAEVNIMREEEGIWNKLGSDLSGASTFIRAIIELNGLIYVGGTFDSAGGVANTRHIAVWNPETDTWSAVGTGAGVGASGVECMAIDASGLLYVGGDFASMGGVANTQRLARWNGTAWSSITPLGVADGVIYDIVVLPTGDIVVGGTFNNINGAGKVKIARYDGSAWNAYGSGMNGTVFALAVDSLGTLYAGGGFTTANGVTVNRITYWNGTTFVSMAGGVSTNNVVDILVDSRDVVWIVGSFSGAYDRIAYWNGVIWIEPGSGLNNTATDVIEDQDGNIIVTGVFTQAGSNDKAKYIAKWNGSSWSHIDVIPNDNVGAMCIAVNGSIYIGHDGLSEVYTSENTSILYEGTAEAYPIITIKPTSGSANIHWIENETTGEILVIDYLALQNETLTIDLTPGNRSITSSKFGSRWSALLPESNSSRFVVKPGINKFKVLVNATTVEVFIKVVNRHWSIDGVAS